MLTFGGVLGGLALVTVLLLPMLWRMRVRARRLGALGLHGSGAGLRRGAQERSQAQVDEAAGTLAAWAEVTDTAWDHGIAPDESETPRQTGARLIRTARLDKATAERVHRAVAAVEQALYAQNPQPAAGAAEDMQWLRTAIRTSVSRRTRLRALLAPRSAVRLTWAFEERRRELGRRWARRRPALWRMARQDGSSEGTAGGAGMV
jgi:hypothetical protein